MYYRKAILSIVFCMLPMVCFAEGAGVKTHKVWLWQESGDSLWNLAKKYYGNPHLWKKIYLANRGKIKDPRVIYPKQILVIPPKN